MNRTWVWPATYRVPGESAWLLAHKFCYINAIGGGLLNRVLGSSDESGRPCSARKNDLFRKIESGPYFSGNDFPNAEFLSDSLPNRRFNGHAEEISSWCVRFCPKCLDSWFHATIFQIEALQRCPAHRCLLMTECPGCGSRWHSDFQDEQFNRPLCCYRCGRPFSGRALKFDEIFPRSISESLEIERFQKLVEIACSRKCLRSGPAPIWTAMGKKKIAFFSCLWMGSGFVDTGLLKLRSLDFHRIPKMKECRQDSSLPEIKTIAQNIRAVGRYVARLARAACGHAKPSTIELEYIGNRTHGNLDIVHPNGACPCCFAVAKWKIQFASLFDILREVREYSDYNHLLYRDFYRSFDDLRWSAEYALASFSFSVLLVAYSAGLLNEETYDNLSHTFRRVESRDTADLLAHGACGHKGLAPIFGGAGGTSLISLPIAEVRKLLSDLAKVRLMQLKSWPSNQSFDTKDGAWGERTSYWFHYKSWIDSRLGCYVAPW